MLRSHAQLFLIYYGLAPLVESQRESGNDVVKDRVRAAKEQFLSLSSDKLKLQCEELKRAKESGQQGWMQEQGFLEGLTTMCDALAKKTPLYQKEMPIKKPALKSLQKMIGGRQHCPMPKCRPPPAGCKYERDHELNERGCPKRMCGVLKCEDKSEGDLAAMMTNQLRATTGNSVAMGCSALLLAKNNGKMEWFENQMWYKKALKTCMSISENSPADLQKNPPVDASPYSHAMALLKASCGSIREIPFDSPMRAKEWFLHSERMCSTVQSSGEEELRSLVHRQRRQAESASGQLIKQTCDKLRQDLSPMKVSDVKDHSPLYQTMVAMCAKLAPKKVSGAGIIARCKWLREAKETGKDQRFKKAPWFARLETTCAWLKERVESSKKRLESRGATVLV